MHIVHGYVSIYSTVARLCIAQCILYIVHCTKCVYSTYTRYSAQYTEYSVYCILYTIQCILYTIYTIQYTVYRVICVIWVICVVLSIHSVECSRIIQPWILLPLLMIQKSEFSLRLPNISPTLYLIYSFYIHFSQKQLPREVKSRLVIMECTGYIFWQLFLRRL